MPIFWTQDLKLVKRLEIQVKIQDEVLVRVSRVKGQEKSSSYIRHYIEIQVQEIPDRIFRCLWIAYNSLRQALLLYLIFSPFFYSNLEAMYSNTFLSMSLHPKFLFDFSRATSSLASPNLIKLMDSFECPKSINNTFLPSPSSDFLKLPQSMPIATASVTSFTFLMPEIQAAFKKAFFSISVKYEGTENTISFQSKLLCWIIEVSWVMNPARTCSAVRDSSLPFSWTLKQTRSDSSLVAHGQFQSYLWLY